MVTACVQKEDPEFAAAEVGAEVGWVVAADDDDVFEEPHALSARTMAPARSAPEATRGRCMVLPLEMGGSIVAAAEHHTTHPAHRVPVLVRLALLERDDRVVGDVDVFRAQLGAALGDVATPEPTLGARLLGAIEDVLGMHLQPRDTHEEPRSIELVRQPMGAVDVAHILAQVALDALAELVEPVDVRLLDAPRRAVVRRRGERRNLLVDFV